MKYYCEGCKAGFSDKRKARPLKEMLLKKKTGGPPCPDYCPDCGALITPEHFSQIERAQWFEFFSRCPTAHFCCEHNSYRPECEKMIFYPGCLTMIHYQLAELKYALEKINGVDISAMRCEETVAAVMKELDDQS